LRAASIATTTEVIDFMRTLVSVLPALACAGMLLFICLPMMFSRRKLPTTEEAATRAEVAELREEVARLREEKQGMERHKSEVATKDAS
jgi:hypothetical protein